MISVKMDQSSQAARWKLKTSIARPKEDDFDSLALVSYKIQGDFLIGPLVQYQSEKRTTTNDPARGSFR